MEKFDPNTITFSDAALNHFISSLADRGHGYGIKIGVKEAGCSGYEYFFNFADEVNPTDHVFNENGCRIYIDKESLKFLSGSKVDFTKDGLNSGIKFINPNAKAVCGCGESFTI